MNLASSIPARCDVCSIPTGWEVCVLYKFYVISLSVTYKNVQHTVSFIRVHRFPPINNLTAMI